MEVNMDYTIYTKIKEKNGGIKEVKAVDLTFYCRCPKCNKESKIFLFSEIANDPDFDPFTTRIYCESCSASFDEIRKRIKRTSADVDNMPVDKLNLISNLLDELEKYIEE